VTSVDRENFGTDLDLGHFFNILGRFRHYIGLLRMLLMNVLEI